MSPKKDCCEWCGAPKEEGCEDPVACEKEIQAELRGRMEEELDRARQEIEERYAGGY